MKKILMSVVLAGAVLFGACAEYFGDVVKPIATGERTLNGTKDKNGEIITGAPPVGHVELYDVNGYIVEVYESYKKYSAEEENKFGKIFNKVLNVGEFQVGDKNIDEYTAVCLAAQLPNQWKTFTVQSPTKGEDGKYYMILGCRKSDGEIRYRVLPSANKYKPKLD